MEPGICNAEMVWPQDTPAHFDLTQIKGIIMFHFADCNIKGVVQRARVYRQKEKIRW